MSEKLLKAMLNLNKQQQIATCVTFEIHKQEHCFKFRIFY